MPKHKKSRLFSSGDIELSSLDTLLCFCFGGDEKNVKKCNLLCSPSPGVFFSSEGKTDISHLAVCSLWRFAYALTLNLCVTLTGGFKQNTSARRGRKGRRTETAARRRKIINNLKSNYTCMCVAANLDSRVCPPASGCSWTFSLWSHDFWGWQRNNWAFLIGRKLRVIKDSHSELRGGKNKNEKQTHEHMNLTCLPTPDSQANTR